MRTWRQTYGYPIWYPWAFLLLILIGIAAVIAAFWPLNLRSLVVAVICGLFVLPALRGR